VGQRGSSRVQDLHYVLKNVEAVDMMAAGLLT
jgi:hypothetical protein